jgi:thioredoxin-like negative regulator of GroEL
MPGKKLDDRDRDERREDALRPCPYLGYDRDSLAMYLMEREAYKIAETQFRRAVWLNPFEARFKAHLAWCLYKQERHAEALACLAEIPEQAVNEDIENIARFIKHVASDKSGGKNKC